MKALITTTIICLLLLVTKINADTLFFDTEINIDGSDILDAPADQAISFGFGDPNLGTLPQFDPTTGTLVSATLTISGDLDYEIFIEGGDVINESLPNETFAGLQIAISGVVPLSTGIFLTPTDRIFDTVGCSADPFDGPCSEFTDGLFLADANAILLVLIWQPLLAQVSLIALA